MRIMIVDDHWGWRRFLGGLLGSGYSIIECTDGPSAIAACDQALPDWILMDIAMEPMDGFTAASIIRTRHPGTRIVFVTQHASRKFHDRVSGMGLTLVPKEEAWRLSEILSATPDST